jgi:hypothetical protein
MSLSHAPDRLRRSPLSRTGIQLFALAGLAFWAGSLAAASSALAQDPDGHWSTFFGGGPSGFALGEYDGDLIVAGEFWRVAGVNSRSVAAMHDGFWKPLASGIDAHVYTVAVYQDKLWAAGWTNVGVPLVPVMYSWDGSAWNQEGTWEGVLVRALTVFQDKLIAGGSLMGVNGNQLAGVASWDGNAWEPMGNLIGGWGAEVRAFTVYRGELFAGGSFHNSPPRSLARWTGTEWAAVDGEPDGRVRALLATDDGLVVAGEFDHAGGISVQGVAIWNGTEWRALGDGLRRQGNGSVSGLATLEGKLVAAGAFRVSGTPPLSNIAVWDGAAWEPLGSGIDPEYWAAGYSGIRPPGSPAIAGPHGGEVPAGIEEGVYAVRSYQGCLYASGVFDWAGGKLADGFACWNPQDAPSGGRAPFLLSAPFPNPSSERFDFLLRLDVASEVQFSVFDLQGRRVAQLLEGPMSAGQHTAAWDGRGEDGHPARSSVYQVVLRSGGSSVMRRIVLIR